MSDYGVFVDDNRHSCIRVKIGHKHTQFIPFAAGELRVHQMTNAEFDKTYKELPDYAPQRAAETYLFDKDNVKREVTSEARAHLERLAGPPFKREKLADDPAPKPQPQPKKEATMAKKETAAAEAAPAKRKPAAKTEAAAPAKKAAAAKKAPAKKAAKDEATGTRGRAPNIEGTAKIKVLAKENPKRANAAERFALYKNGMTVDEYIAAGGKRADVNWDVAQGFIEVK